jgi:uncharacterized circularly permuted ATP-grasp superfamily protein/uncharacterized alpha-E superfamily protein
MEKFSADGTDVNAFHDLLSAYQKFDGTYDELISDDNEIRPAYRRLIGIEPRLTGPEVYLRWRAAKQSLKDNPPASTGQTLRGGTPLSWDLDPIPMVIDAKEWAVLAAGMRQRMQVLDLLLRDVYGPQKLLADGVLPSELVWGCPAYLRAAQRTDENQNNRMLYLYAAQISRAHNGQWQVLADRTQGPSGCGHAVENRLATSRILSEDFQKLQVQRLAGFFSTLRQSLQDASPLKEKSSRSALLSPGVRSQTYFEDAYLARYLGYTLTQTADLTVRGGAVYLKTLGGLVRIDSILRRLPDYMCDPLEIDPSSSEGIAGLAQAARQNQVLLANSLGTGWTESPAVTAILPRICKALLGEDLKLPSLPMWWCGDRESMEFVIAHLDRLLLRDAFVRHSATQTVGAYLDHDQKNAIIADIRKNPWRYVATRFPEYSRTPAWINNHVVACPVVIRLLGCASRDKQEIMPGGIARISDSVEKLDESLVCGTMSKDVWVLSQGPVKPFSLLSPGKQSVELRRTAMDLPSRVAEHLFWLGRFAERTEFMARHARYCSAQLTSEISQDALPGFWLVVRSLREKSSLAPEAPVQDEAAALLEMRKFVLDFVFNQKDFDSLPNSVNGILRNAETIRDRLSFDSWQILSRLDYSVLTSWGGKQERMGESLTTLNQMISNLSAFAGLASESMTRGPGWHFLDLGRRIDRAQNLLRLIDHLLVPYLKSSRTLLESLLEICDSSMTYRYRYLMSYEIGPVLDLLVVDPSNPRGLAFQFVQILHHLDSLPAADKAEVARQRKKITECRGLLRLFDGEALGDDIVDNDSHRRERPMLRETLREFSAQLNDLADFISRRFLTHTEARQLEDMVNQ